MRSKEARVYRGPSKQGPCVVCGKQGIRRYMIAADLPSPMILCDSDYNQIRSRLQEALRDILQDEGVLPETLVHIKAGRISVKVEKEVEKGE